MSNLGAGAAEIGLVYSLSGAIPLALHNVGSLLWDYFSPQTPFLITVIDCLGLSLLAFWKLRAPQETMPTKPELQYTLLLTRFSILQTPSS